MRENITKGNHFIKELRIVNGLKSSRNGLAALILLVSAVVLLTPGATYGQTEPNPVVVVNTSRQPVPVTGSVSVDNTPTVRLDPSANTVSIVSSRAPFQALIPVSLATMAPCKDLTIPNGKRLVLEYVSANLSTPNFVNETPRVFVGLYNPPFLGLPPARVYVDLHEQTAPIEVGGRRWAGSEQLRVYADGVSFNLRVCALVTLYPINGMVILSGYTEDQ